MDSIYKTVLLDHFHNPRNKGEVSEMDFIERGSNPRCGDDIEVGVSLNDEGLSTVRFRGRGCSICLASASMMAESTTGLELQKMHELVHQMIEWFDNNNVKAPPNSTLEALDAVRKHPARAKCVILAWNALELALSQQDG